ncbi:MAG: type VI secretion system tube protein Hcp [Burkholderiales bacterium]|jgi:type VI secretion system secreted protein Hcp|nr:type VI secretion system tube protein Hcp [Burkholderiales bacterium]
MKDIYLKFDNPTVKSESMDKDHAGWIEVDFWESTLKQPRSVTASTAGGHTSERTEHAPMVFHKLLDLSSPLLYQHLSGGTTFDEVTVEFFRADGEGNRVKYLEIKMKHVIISEIASYASEHGLPFEEIQLKYAAIQWKYSKQKVGGNVLGNTQGAWSLTKNDKTYSV